jgi:ketosteroid isomerase-like protein
MAKNDSTKIAANKALALDFFSDFSQGIGPALRYLDDDVVWWTAPGIYSKDAIARTMIGQEKDLISPITHRVQMVTAEGDRVAVESESHGELKNGRVYTNKYHWLLRIRNGKIIEIHEHCDTYHAIKVWSDSVPLYGGQGIPTPAPWPREPALK